MDPVIPERGNSAPAQGPAPAPAPPTPQNTPPNNAAQQQGPQNQDGQGQDGQPAAQNNPPNDMDGQDPLQVVAVAGNQNDQVMVLEDDDLADAEALDTDSDDDEEFVLDAAEGVLVAAVQQRPERPRRPKRGAGTDDDDDGPLGQPTAKRSANEEIGTPQENMQKISRVLEQIVGLSMAGIADLFLRNEPGLLNTVEELRQTLTRHQGQLSPEWETLREGLGPPDPRKMANRATPSTSDDRTPNVAPQPLNSQSAKAILNHLGRVLELYSALIKRLGYGNTSPSSPNARDYNRIAYVLHQTIGQLSDVLLYTFRRKLNYIVDDLNKQEPKFRERIEKAIAGARAALAENPNMYANLRGTPLLQMLPPSVYPALDNPNIRYFISIPQEDLRSHPTQITIDPAKAASEELPTNALVQGEENLLIRFGSGLELINGSRTTSLSYSVHDIQFSIYQSYVTQGWVDANAPDPPGQYVRALEFNLQQFDESSIGHQIKMANKITDEQSQQLQVALSGVVKENLTTKGVVGKRVEFVFLLPPHLTMQHVNDVGIRDSILKIQFSK